jgi:hypothetical protein
MCALGVMLMREIRGPRKFPLTMRTTTFFLRSVDPAFPPPKNGAVSACTYLTKIGREAVVVPRKGDNELVTKVINPHQRGTVSGAHARMLCGTRVPPERALGRELGVTGLRAGRGRWPPPAMANHLGVQAIPASVAGGAVGPFNWPPGQGFNCPVPVSPAASRAGVAIVQPLTTKSRHSKFAGVMGSPH